MRSMAASKAGKHEVVAWLLRECPQRPGIRMRSQTGDMALHYAAMSGDLLTLKILIDESAPIDEAGDLGNTPLHLAAAYGHSSAVALLVASGAPLQARNAYGNMPLALATDVEARSVLKKAATGGKEALDEIRAQVEEALWEAFNHSGVAMPTTPAGKSIGWGTVMRPPRRPEAVTGDAEPDGGPAETTEEDRARLRRREEDVEEDRIDAEIERLRREEEERIRREEEERLRLEEEERRRLEEEAAAKKKKKGKGKGKGKGKKAKK